MTTKARTACAMCVSDFEVSDLINVGGYPLCRPCLEQVSREIKDRAPRKFRKINDGKYIAGVCGGLADYLNIDRDIFRLIVVFVGLFTGIFPVLIAYFVLALVLSPEP